MRMVRFVIVIMMVRVTALISMLVLMLMLMGVAVRSADVKMGPHFMIGRRMVAAARMRVRYRR
jgi:hypothetical protein